MSINISPGGSRFRGELCQHEQEPVDYRAAHPELAPVDPTRRY